MITLYQSVIVRIVLFALVILLNAETTIVAQSGEQDRSKAIDEIRRAHNEKPSDSRVVVRSQERKTTPVQPRNFGSFSSVQVNVDVDGDNIVGDAANEPSMAMNPNDSNSVVVGWRQFDSITSNFRQAGVAFTNDGGTTWNNNGPLTPGIFRSDPVLSEDSSGSIYYYSLSTNSDFSEFFCDMFISSDGGSTWSDPIPAGGGDKQWFTIDKSSGTSDGFVHAMWSPFFSCCPSGFFTRSIDNGLNYLKPINLPELIFWGTVSVGPAGELYICGRSIDNEPVVIRSDNAEVGAQIPEFPQVVTVDLNGGTLNGEGPNPGGLLGQFDVETDHSTGASNGNVYLLCSVNPPGPDPLDVMFARSTDGGLTWCSPVRINEDAEAEGAYNWFGTMSVAPNGRIDVIWNDMRSNPGGQMSAMYYSASEDGGLTWSENLQVTPEFNSLIGHPQQNKIGDYYDMRSTNDAVHVAYSATFNGEQDVYYLKIDTTGIILGDVNQDGVVDLLDVAPFVELLSNGQYQVEADTNQDGLLNLLDIQPFIELISGK